MKEYQRRALPSVPVGDGMSAHLGASQSSAGHRGRSNHTSAGKLPLVPIIRCPEYRCNLGEHATAVRSLKPGPLWAEQTGRPDCNPPQGPGSACGCRLMVVLMCRWPNNS